MKTRWLGAAAAALAAMGGGASAQAGPDCPILASRGWEAWVDGTPSLEGGRRLHVVGEVDTPTPGYSFAWRLGPADRAFPPAQRLALIPTPPEGMVAQVVTTEQVAFEGDALYPSYRGILVVCGGKLIAEIDEVRDAR